MLSHEQIIHITHFRFFFFIIPINLYFFMKRILSLLLICSVCISHAQTQQYKETVITDAPFPMKPIKEFIFPDREFPITKYGAKSDGKTLCTKAFQKAMAACNKAGGGYVVVPQGKWLTGAIHF